MPLRQLAAMTMLGLMALARPSSARADGPVIALSVALVDDGAPNEEVDARVRAELAAQGFTRVVAPPVPYEQLRLTLGCEALRACLDDIAHMLGVDAVVLRRVTGDAPTTTLTLVYRDPGARDAPMETTFVGTPADVTAHAGTLTRQLFVREDATPARELRPWTWATLVASVALLAAGSVLVASGGWGDHATLFAHTPADVDRIENSYDEARTRVAAGGVTIGVGAALAVATIVLAVLDLTQPRSPPTVVASLGPLPGGAALSLAGVW